MISPVLCRSALSVGKLKPIPMSFAGNSHGNKPATPAKKPGSLTEWLGKVLQRPRTLLQIGVMATAAFIVGPIHYAPTQRNSAVAAPIPAAPRFASSESQQMIRFLETQWAAMQAKSLHREDMGWFKLRANLYPLALTGEKGMLPLCKALLQSGQTNAQVPPEAVQDCLTSLGMLGEQLPAQDQATREDMASMVEPYANQVLVETQVDGQIQSRSLQPEAQPDQVPYLPIQSAARYALSKIAAPSFLHQITQQYSATQPNSLDRHQQFELIEPISPQTPLADSLIQTLTTEIQPSKTDPLTRLQIARRVHFLAQRPLNAARQSILLKAIQTGLTQPEETTPFDSELYLLKSLGHLAQHNDRGQKLLTTMLKIRPQLMGLAARHYFQGDNSLACDAGQAVMAAFKRQPLDSLRSQLQTLAEDTTPAAASSRAMALTMMATRPVSAYQKQFEALVQAPDNIYCNLGIIGLVNLRQPEAFAQLASRFADPKTPSHLRTLAGQGLFKLAATPMLPPALEQRIAEDFPLYGDINPFWSADMSGKLLFEPQGNPLDSWYDRGENNPAATPFPALISLGQNPNFQKQTLAPLLSELQSTKLPPGLVPIIIHLFRATRYHPASDTLLKIIRNPAPFYAAPNPSSDFTKAQSLHQIRMAAIRALGAVADPTDPKPVNTLLNLLPESQDLTQQDTRASKYPEYRQATLIALGELGHQITDRLTSPTTPSQEKAALERTQKTTIESLLTKLSALDTTNLTETQRPREKGLWRYLYAQSIIHLGGTDELLNLCKINQKLLNHPTPPPPDPTLVKQWEIDQQVIQTRRKNLIRDLAHALINEGKALDDPLVIPFLSRSYWQVDKMQEQATGKGQGLIITDGNLAFEADIPEKYRPFALNLKGKIHYPKNMVYRPQYFMDGSHWLQVLSLALAVAPDTENIYTRTWCHPIHRPNPHMTKPMQNTSVIAMLDTLRTRMLPPGHPEREEANVNTNSWGQYTNTIYNEENRQYYNVLSALYEGFSELGGSTVFSGGNGGWDRDTSYFALERGNSPIGDAFTAKGECVPTPGVYYAAPNDAWLGQLSSRASVPAPSLKDQRPVFKTPGVEVIAYIDEYTGKVQYDYGNASSFAAPMLSGTLVNGYQVEKDLAQKPLTTQQRLKALVDAGHPTEFGTRELAPVTFLQNLRKSTSASALEKTPQDKAK